MKNFQKTICFSLVLMMLFVHGASASSLFDLLPPEPTEVPALQETLAPSYGDFANVSEDEETKNEAGDTIVTYQNVSAQQVNDFGVELAKMGYEILNKESKDEMIAYQLSNSKFTFTVIYDQSASILRTIYPKGVSYAQSLFPGYTKVKPGETFKIKNLAEFTFNTVYLCKDLPSYSRTSYSIDSGEQLDKNDKFVYPHLFLIEFVYKNISTSQRSLEGHSSGFIMGNIFGNEDKYRMKDVIQFIYINEDNMYSFDAIAGGYYEQGDESYLRSEEYYNLGHYRGYQHVEPLETALRAIGFDLPQIAIDDPTGTLALKMDFPNGEKYVLILRENGKNYY